MTYHSIWVSTLLSLFVLWGCNSETSKKTLKSSEVHLVKNIAPGYFKPHWMPDGKQLLVSGVQDKGLYLIDLKTQKLSPLCQAKGAGRNVAVSDDGKHIAYSAFNLIRRRRKNAIHLLDLNGRDQTVFSDAAPCKILGWSANKLIYLVDTVVHAYDPQSGTDSPDPPGISRGYTDLDLHLVWYKAGKSTILDPLEGGNYIWAEMAPDGKSIVFNRAGLGTRICDSQGKLLASLGRLHAPHWTKDGQWLVGMDEHDDGMVFTESDIFKVSRDGKKRINLTPHTSVIALYPRLSPDGKEVVFNTPEGWIYHMSIDGHASH